MPLEEGAATESMLPPDTIARPQLLPASVEATGVSEALLVALLLKALQGGIDDLPGLTDLLRLPGHVVTALLDQVIARKLVRITGAEAQGAMPVLTYSLTPAGRAAAVEAAALSRYLGPAPVGLAAYAAQMRRQTLARAAVDAAAIAAAFADLVLADDFVDRVGPAINAGRSILFYGPPGNGKSSLAKRIGRVFPDVIYLPYAIEVEGQIVRLFDPQVHDEVAEAEGQGEAGIGIRQPAFDRRWVACRRPVVVTGGEFSLDMLELRQIEGAGSYEAPLHIKAVGGSFVIDDFGRQLVKPKDLLNRWMIPLEERVDYLKLDTGATIALPFEELVVFCTNLAPGELMDAAFLRRIPYKIQVGPPSRARFRDIFRRAAAAHGLAAPEPVLDRLIEELESRRRLALGCYQPGFIVDHIMEACRFARRPPAITEDLVTAALDNLYTEEG